jgi:hypothetical protein
LGIIVGNIYNFFVINKIINILAPENSSGIFLISSIIGSIFIIAFYSLIIYLVYKKRNYFNR